MAIKYYAGNRLTGVSGDTKPTSNVLTGTTFLETNTDDLYMWDGDSWNGVAGNTLAETFSNKSFTSAGLTLVESSAPGTPASGVRKVTVGNIIAGGVSSDTIALLNDTTIASVASANILIYDGSDSWDNKAVSGDATINTSGVVAITSDVIVNADVKSDAAIAMSKTALVAGTGITLATNTLNVDAAQTQITSVGALDAGSITSNFGTINTGASAITTTGLISGGSLDIDDVLINGATIGHTDDTDLITVANGALTLAGTLTVSGNTTLNSGILDVKNGGTASVVRLYCETNNAHYSELKADAHSNFSGNVTLTLPVATGTLVGTGNLTAIVTTGALNSGSITSGFGTIDTGSSNITTTGTVSAGNLTVTGTTTTVNSTVLTVVDPIIHLQPASGGGNLSSDTNKDVGLMMEYHNGSAAKQAFLGWDDSASKLTFVPDATLSSEVVSGSVGTLVANLEGNVSGGAYTGTVINDDYIDTINNANKVALTALDIDGGTEIGAAIVDADLFIIDDGAGGTNRKVLASRIATYAAASAATEAFAIAMAVAL